MSTAVLPRTIHEPLRRVGSGLLAPLRFATVTGHFRSSLHGKAYDAAGDVLPWYSYPMIDLLSQKDFSDKSGIWRRALDAMGARRAARVVSFEEDQAWHARIAPLLPQNAQLYFVPDLRNETLISSQSGDRY
jgi:hypothetical protein